MLFLLLVPQEGVQGFDIGDAVVFVGGIVVQNGGESVMRPYPTAVHRPHTHGIGRSVGRVAEAGNLGRKQNRKTLNFLSLTRLKHTGTCAGGYLGVAAAG